jgi:hypothetical protein
MASLFRSLMRSEFATEFAPLTVDTGENWRGWLISELLGGVLIRLFKLAVATSHR